MTGTYRTLGPESRSARRSPRRSALRTRACRFRPRAPRRPRRHHLHRARGPRPDRRRHDLAGPDQQHDPGLHLIDPNGALTQISYDYGTPSTRTGRNGTVPNIQHVEVANPECRAPGRRRSGGPTAARTCRSRRTCPAPTPATCRFRATGSNYGHVAGRAQRSPSRPHSSRDGDAAGHLPARPGDHPESVQFVSDTVRRTSLPIARRTLVAAARAASSTRRSPAPSGAGSARSARTTSTCRPASTDLDVKLQTAGRQPGQPDDVLPGQPQRAGRRRGRRPRRRRFRATVNDARDQGRTSSSRTRRPGRGRSTSSST